jgi:hypothetical protein
MLRRAGVIGLALALAGCTDNLVLNDVRDTGTSTDVSKDGAGLGVEAYCGLTKKSIDFVPGSPQIIIVLDRSSSMQSYFGGTTKKMTAQSALVKAVSKYQARIQFGFEQFPSNPSDPQCQPGGCCAGPVDPPPGPNNLPLMTSGIQCSDLAGSSCPSAGSDSPSYLALAAVRDYYKARYQNEPADEDRYVLLVTSSEPSCASESHDVCASARSAASDLGRLGPPGVRIIVLSLGYVPDQGSCLFKISQTSSSLLKPDNTSYLYTPYSVDDLAYDLDRFFLAVARASCTLTSQTLPPSHAQVTVSIGQDQIQQTDGSSPGGWVYSSPDHTSITLLGQDCDNWVQSQATTPDVGYSCSPCGGPNACSTLWQQP